MWQIGLSFDRSCDRAALISYVQIIVGMNPNREEMGVYVQIIVVKFIRNIIKGILDRAKSVHFVECSDNRGVHSAGDRCMQYSRVISISRSEFD
jgi:hypothetical protein